LGEVPGPLWGGLEDEQPEALMEEEEEVVEVEQDVVDENGGILYTKVMPTPSNAVSFAVIIVLVFDVFVLFVLRFVFFSFFVKCC
jgi:hypothetical protein